MVFKAFRGYTCVQLLDHVALTRSGNLQPVASGMISVASTAPPSPKSQNMPSQARGQRKKVFKGLKLCHSLAKRITLKL